MTGSVVVGGDIHYNTPSITGDVSAKGAVDFSGGGGSVSGAIQYGTTYSGPGYLGTSQTQVSPGSITLPVDFAVAAADLTAKSVYWDSLTPTVTNSGQFGAVTVNLASGLNILNLDASTFQNSTGFTFNGAPDAYLLVNVTNAGNLSTITLPNVATAYNGGFGTANLLFNFAELGSSQSLGALNVSGSFFGSVLAPYANVTAASGGFNGQLIAASGNTGNLEIHKYDFGNHGGPGTYFKGSLPSPPSNSVPEPGTLALVGMMLPLGGLVRKMRR